MCNNEGSSFWIPNSVQFPSKFLWLLAPFWISGSFFITQNFHELARINFYIGRAGDVNSRTEWPAHSSPPGPIRMRAAPSFWSQIQPVMRFSTVFNRYTHKQITTGRMLAPSHINTDGRSSLILFLRIAAQGKAFMGGSNIRPHTSHPTCQLVWLGVHYCITHTHIHTGERDPIGDDCEQFHEQTEHTMMVRPRVWPDQWVDQLPAYM